MKPSSNRAMSPIIHVTEMRAFEERSPPFVRCLTWLPQYLRDRATLREDILGGLTVGVMVVPQSMAYAMLAGLPPIYGLYSSLLPPFIYALLGDSKHLQVGPVSMVSLLTAAGVGAMFRPADAMYPVLASWIGLLAGVTQVLLGLFRLGSLVDFASRPIIAGFTSGASVVVIVAQMQHILGLSVPSGATTLHTAWNTVRTVLHSGGPHLPSLVLGVGFLLALNASKQLVKKYPDVPVLKAVGPLSVVALGTLVVGVLKLDAMQVKVIGTIPDGMPSLPSVTDVARAARLTFHHTVLETALAIAFISFMESIAVAKTLSQRHGYEVEANQELKALGTANIMGTFTRGYAGAGAFSRSAVASEAGARSQVAAMVSSLVVLVTLLFLTPAFYYLPKGALAAIVIQAVWGLIDIHEALGLWRVCRRDLFLWVVAFCGTLHTVHAGITVSVAISLLLIVRDATRTTIEELGTLRHESSTVYVPLASHKDAVSMTYPTVLRINGPVYGGGSSTLRAGVAPYKNNDIVFDMSAVSHMDSAGLTVLKDLGAEATAAGRVIGFAATRPSIVKMLEAQKETDAHFRLFHTVHEAVEMLNQRCSV